MELFDNDDEYGVFLWILVTGVKDEGMDLRNLRF